MASNWARIFLDLAISGLLRSGDLPRRAFVVGLPLRVETLLSRLDLPIGILNRRRDLPAGALVIARLLGLKTLVSGLPLRCRRPNTPNEYGNGHCHGRKRRDRKPLRPSGKCVSEHERDACQDRNPHHTPDRLRS